MSHATRWTNWVGNQSFTPAEIIPITHADAIAPIIQRAAAASRSVRTYGTGHSFTPIVETSDVLLDTSVLRGILSIDVAARTVSALPKTTIGDFGAPLWEHGLALSNQGDIDTQAIAGAVATATHGSGRRFGNFSSVLEGATIIDGLGNMHDITRAADPDVLHALQTSLGLLGIMTRMTMRVAPAYTLHAEGKLMRFDDLLAQFDHYVNDYRHVSLFWLPTDASAALYCLDHGAADDCVVKLYQEHPADAHLAHGKDERFGRSYEIYPMHYEPNFHEMEYFLPLEYARDIMTEMRKLMQRWLPLSVYPLEIRTVGADEAWMSPNYRRENLVVSISGQPGTEYWPYLRACDALFAEFKGRPHWGKLHFMTADRLARLFPRYADFVAMRRKFDPQGTYLNPHTWPLFA